MEEEREKVMGYDPIKADFVDENGEESTVYVEPTNTYQVNMGKGPYKLAHTNPLVKKRTKSLLISDIGSHSRGFAQVAGLAVVAALAVIIICYLIFRF